MADPQNDARKPSQLRPDPINVEPAGRTKVGIPDLPSFIEFGPRLRTRTRANRSSSALHASKAAAPALADRRAWPRRAVLEDLRRDMHVEQPRSPWAGWVLAR